MLFIDFIFSGPLIKILFPLVLILAPTFFSNFISVLIILGFKLFICKLPFASVAATQNVPASIPVSYTHLTLPTSHLV